MNMIESKSGVYAIYNKVDGKIYVGSAKNTDQRKYVHFRQLNIGNHHSRKLQRAWIKYGSTIFSFSVLESVGDESQLIPSEQRWIDKLNAYGPNGYNMIPKAGSNLGLVHSVQAREKMAVKATGRIVSSDTRAKMSASSHRVRPKLSQECKDKISKALKGIPLSAETRVKIGKAGIGRVKSPETCAKMSASMKGKNTGKHSPEHCAKISQGLRGNSNALGYKHSKETRARVSAASKGRMYSAERNAALSAKLKGKKHSAEHVAKCVATRWGRPIKCI